MEPIKLDNLGGANPQNAATSPNSTNGAAEAQKINLGNPNSISINFQPQTPSASNAAVPTTDPQKPEVVSLEVKKSDLNKTEPANLSKPSTAWGGALDVSKETKPADSADKTKIDFFSNASLQEKATGSHLMENITSQKLKVEQPKIGDLLGKQSKILEKTIEQETLLNYKKRLRLVQFMTIMVFLVAFGINTYLSVQLSPGISVAGFNYNFSSNLRDDLFNLNENLRATQTELNAYRFLSGQLYLNQFSYAATSFLDASDNTTQEENAIADKQRIIAETKDLMPKMLKGAKENLTKPIVVNTFFTRGEEVKDENTLNFEFQKRLRDTILAVKKSVVDSKAENLTASDKAEINFYNNSAKMVSNKKLIDNLVAINPDNLKNQADLYSSADADPVQKDSFKKMVNGILDSTKVNLATVTNLKNARISWSDVLNKIETITTRVNSDHNANSGNRNNSVITYSGIEFNGDTGKVSVSGLNTTKTGTNRDVITYLMEAFESSPDFKNASNRSFPLNKTVETDGSTSYSMNFRIEMEIERGSFSKLNAPIADLLNGGRQTARALVRRIK